MNFIGYLFILSLVISLSLNAETVVLKTGKSFRGKVIDQNRDILKLQDNEGNITQFQKDEILKVTYKDLTDKEVLKLIEKEAAKLAVQPPQIEKTGLDDEILGGLVEQNKQIIALTDEVISLSRELEKQNQRIETIEKKFKVSPKKVRWGVVARSAILPGWGQYHWDEPVWGSIYMISFLVAGASYSNQYSKFQKAKSAYQDNTDSLLFLSTGQAGFLFNFTNNSNERKEYTKSARGVNSASSALIGIYLINLIDAFLYRADKDEVAWDSNGKKLGLTLDVDYHNTSFRGASASRDKTARDTEYKLSYTWTF